MRLPRTITLPARNALMALPYWPEPPGPALMSAMRLSSTWVPSSPTVPRRISMPLSFVPFIVLRETSRPCASSDTIAVVADLVMILPLMSPETFSNQMPLPPEPSISQSVTRMLRRQRNAGAIQREVGKTDAVGAFALKHRRAAGEHEPGRAAHADQLGAALQAKHAGAIDARRQRQRHLRAGGIVDRPLQDLGLVVGTAGPD